jgi:hypothetical protein
VSTNPTRAPVGVSLNDDELAAVDGAAYATGLSRAAWIRAQLLDALDQPLTCTGDGPPGRPMRHRGVTVHLRRVDRDRLVQLAEEEGTTVGAWARGQLIARLPALAPSGRPGSPAAGRRRERPAPGRRPPGLAYTAAIGLPVHAEEAERVSAAAERAGVARSVWLRTILLAALDIPAGGARHDGISPRLVALTAHVTPAEHARVQLAAAATGVTVGRWARRQVLAYLELDAGD